MCSGGNNQERPADAGVIAEHVLSEERQDIRAESEAEKVDYEQVESRGLTAHLVGHDLLHGGRPDRVRVRTKGEIKDFVAAHPAYTNDRIDGLLARYRRFPEDFYRASPIVGAYYTLPLNGSQRFVACTRLKRFRRIAEKGSRRIIDFILARIRAVLRRVRDPDLQREDEVRIGDARVSFLSGKVIRDDQEFALGYYEGEVLKQLLATTGQVVDRKQMLKEIWGVENEPMNRSVDNHIVSLRRKVEEDASKPRHILTVHGLGYKLVP